MEQEGSYLVEKKVDYLVSMKLGKVTETLESAVKKITELESEIETLKKKVTRLNTGVCAQTTLAPSGEKEVKKEAPSTDSNSKTGGITPEEVSVEKMFYFGNKA